MCGKISNSPKSKLYKPEFLIRDLAIFNRTSIIYILWLRVILSLFFFQQATLGCLGLDLSPTHDDDLEGI